MYRLCSNNTFCTWWHLQATGHQYLPNMLHPPIFRCHSLKFLFQRRLQWTLQMRILQAILKVRQMMLPLNRNDVLQLTCGGREFPFLSLTAVMMGLLLAGVQVPEPSIVTTCAQERRESTPKNMGCSRRIKTNFLVTGRCQAGLCNNMPNIKVYSKWSW